MRISLLRLRAMCWSCLLCSPAWQRQQKGPRESKRQMIRHATHRPDLEGILRTICNHHDAALQRTARRACVSTPRWCLGQLGGVHGARMRSSTPGKLCCKNLLLHNAVPTDCGLAEHGTHSYSRCACGSPTLVTLCGVAKAHACAPPRVNRKHVKKIA